MRNQTRLVTTLLETTRRTFDEPQHRPPTMEPRTLRETTRVSVVENSTGQRAVVCKSAALKRLYRASGRPCTYWSTDASWTIFRTHSGLLVRRHRYGKAITAQRFFATTADDAEQTSTATADGFLYEQGITLAQKRRISAALLETVGPAPVAAHRFPLLACDDSDGFAVTLEGITNATALYQDPWLDCVDAAQVARKLFGARHYRKPLAQQVTRTNNNTLVFYSLFRGLVPPEWIIDALRVLDDEAAPRPRELSARQWRALRTLLTRTPQPVLRRMLKEPVIPMTTALRDTANELAAGPVQLRNYDEIATLIAATGHRNIRTSNDLHTLILNLPAAPKRQGATARSRAAEAAVNRERNLENSLYRVNCHRTATATPHLTWEQWLSLAATEQDQLLALARPWEEQQREQQRAHDAQQQLEHEHQAERARLDRIAADPTGAAWAAETTRKLTAAGDLGGLTIVVATTAQQLRQWGAQMRNCIGSYHQEIGLDVLLGLFRDDHLVANAEITHTDGLVQLLARHNQDFEQAKDLGIDLGRAVLADLTALGIPICPHGWGLSALTEPAPHAEDGTPTRP